MAAKFRQVVVHSSLSRKSDGSSAGKTPEGVRDADLSVHYNGGTGSLVPSVVPNSSGP